MCLPVGFGNCPKHLGPSKRPLVEVQNLAMEVLTQSVAGPIMLWVNPPARHTRASCAVSVPCFQDILSILD